MQTYQILYREGYPQSKGVNHYLYINASDPEDAAYQALDWTTIHQYNLVDVRRIYHK